MNTVDVSQVSTSPQSVVPRHKINPKFLDLTLDDPIKEKELWGFFEKQEAMFWNVDRLGIGVKDTNTFKKLPPKTQEYMKDAIALFHVIDVYIGHMISINITAYIADPEGLAFYGAQAHIENVHNRFYGKVVEQILGSEHANNKAKKIAFLERPSSIEQILWFEKWLSNVDSMETIFGVLVIAEGVVIQDGFVPFMLMDVLNVCPAIVEGNKSVMVDEFLHNQVAMYYLNEVDRWEPENEQDRNPNIKYLKFNHDALKARGITLRHKGGNFKAKFMEMLHSAINIKIRSIQNSSLKDVEMEKITVEKAITHVKYIGNYISSQLKMFGGKFLFSKILESPLYFMSRVYSSNDVKMNLHEVQSPNYKFYNVKSIDKDENKNDRNGKSVVDRNLLEELNVIMSNSSSSDEEDMSSSSSSVLSSMSGENVLKKNILAVLGPKDNDDDDDDDDDD